MGLGGLALGLTAVVRFEGLLDVLPAIPFIGILLAAPEQDGPAAGHRPGDRRGLRAGRRLPAGPAVHRLAAAHAGADRAARRVADRADPGRGGTTAPARPAASRAGRRLGKAPAALAARCRRSAGRGRSDRLRDPPVPADRARAGQPRGGLLRRRPAAPRAPAGRSRAAVRRGHPVLGHLVHRAAGRAAGRVRPSAAGAAVPAGPVLLAGPIGHGSHLGAAARGHRLGLGRRVVAAGDPPGPAMGQPPPGAAGASRADPLRDLGVRMASRPRAITGRGPGGRARSWPRAAWWRCSCPP